MASISQQISELDVIVNETEEKLIRLHHQRELLLDAPSDETDLYVLQDYINGKQFFIRSSSPELAAAVAYVYDPEAVPTKDVEVTRATQRDVKFPKHLNTSPQGWIFADSGVIDFQR